MANHHFQGGSTSSSWWVAAARTTTTAAAGFNVVDPPPASVSSSTDQLGGSSFNWPSAAADLLEAKSRSSDESPVSISGSSITFQEIQNSQTPSAMIAAPLLDTATPQALDFGLSSPTIDSWTQPFFGGRGESSFHSLLQEDVLESNQIHPGIDHSSSLNRSSLFLQDSGHVLSSNNIPLLLSSSSNSAVLQGLVEPDQSSRPSLQRSLFYDAQPMLKNMRSTSSNINLYDHGEELDESSALQSNSLVKLPQFFKALPNNRSTNSSISVTEARYPNFHHARPSQVLPVLQNDNSSYSSNNLFAKASSGVGGSNLSNMEKRTGSALALKKPRLGAPSSSPAFKVRKEKLGDRITALQQLVSPFGKTDTASVLHEAIEYIKFLHDQVRVSSAPYLKNGQQLQQVKSMDQKTKDCEGHEEDLRSRGLCLVPISSTFAVANEIPPDFWTPTIVGSFR